MTEFALRGIPIGINLHPRSYYSPFSTSTPCTYPNEPYMRTMSRFEKSNECLQLTKLFVSLI